VQVAQYQHRPAAEHPRGIANAREVEPNDGAF